MLVIQLQKVQQEYKELDCVYKRIQHETKTKECACFEDKTKHEMLIRNQLKREIDNCKISLEVILQRFFWRDHRVSKIYSSFIYLGRKGCKGRTGSTAARSRRNIHVCHRKGQGAEIPIRQREERSPEGKEEAGGGNRCTKEEGLSAEETSSYRAGSMTQSSNIRDTYCVGATGH